MMRPVIRAPTTNQPTATPAIAPDRPSLSMIDTGAEVPVIDGIGRVGISLLKGELVNSKAAVELCVGVGMLDTTAASAGWGFIPSSVTTVVAILQQPAPPGVLPHLIRLLLLPQ